MKLSGLFLILLLPFAVYSQPVGDQYSRVIDFVQDSIIQTDTGNYYIFNIIFAKPGIADFLGISEACEIQHQLLIEILLSGNQLDTVSGIINNIPLHLQDSNKRYKIEFYSITAYNDIWATVVQVIDHELPEDNNEWDKYSLLFIKEKLIGVLYGRWHRDF